MTRLKASEEVWGKWLISWNNSIQLRLIKTHLKLIYVDNPSEQRHGSKILSEVVCVNSKDREVSKLAEAIFLLIPRHLNRISVARSVKLDGILRSPLVSAHDEVEMGLKPETVDVPLNI